MGARSEEDIVRGISHRVREVRLALKLTQEVVAERAALTAETSVVATTRP